jgi:hypothetical protein
MDAGSFCTAFACALTTPSSEEGALIGRNGEESIFAILVKMLPQVSWGKTQCITRQAL